jgi:hypothetical protein
MASTYSTNLRLELMATNENLDTWGPKANNVFNLIEDSVSGATTVNMNNTTYTMSTANGVDDESRALFIICSGSHTAVRVLNLPAYPKMYIIRNATSGGHDVQITRSASTYLLPNGDTILLYCTGTVIYPVGYSRTEVQDLFSTEEVTTPRLLVSDPGDEAAPAISFSGDDDTGFFSDSGVIGITTNGGEVARFSTTNFLMGNDSLIFPSVDAKVGVQFSTSGGFIASAENNPCAGFKRNNNGQLIQFFRATAVVGSIQVDSTSTVYAETSDYRQKKDIQELTSVGELIDKLRPVEFRWKATNEKRVGFIAHEVQEIAPYAVTGEKDGEEMQGLEQGKLMALAIAEIKSLRERVARLERQAMIPRT